MCLLKRQRGAWGPGQAPAGLHSPVFGNLWVVDFLQHPRAQSDSHRPWVGAESLARLPGGHGMGGLVGPPPLPSHCSVDSAPGGKRQELEGAVFVQDGESALELHGLGAPGPLPFISGKPGAASACLTHETQEAQGLGPQHLQAPAKML